MSYISPIKIGEIPQMEEGWADKIGRYIAGEVDNLVLESCVKVGCHVDKDELEKALRYDRDQYSKGYADGKRDAAPRWHRVEDELPEPNIQCLVRDDDNNCAVGYYRQDARAWDSPFFGWLERDDEYYKDGDLCRIGKVVAWMPIEPQKEDA